MPQCKAKFCKVKRGRGFSTFKIPDPKRNKALCERWINNLGIEKLNINTYVFSSNNMVCEKHFEKDCFLEDLQAKMLGYVPKKKRLKPDAVPTIFADSREPPKRKLTCTPMKNAKKEHPELNQLMSEELLNRKPEISPNSDDCKVSKPKRKRLLKESGKIVSTKTKTTENMPFKKRRVESMSKKRRTRKISESSEGTVEVENETTWPDPVVKVEVEVDEEDFHSFNQEHPYADVSSADIEASLPVFMVIDNAYSLHTSSIASCTSSAFNNYELLKVKTEHDNVNESSVTDISRNFEIKTKYDNVSRSTGIDVSRNFEIETAHDNVNESTYTNVLRNFEIETAHNNVNESTGINVSRNFEIETAHDNVNESTGIDVSRNFEIETAHDNVNESTVADISRNFEIKTKYDNVSRSTGIDVSRNFEIETAHDNVNESTYTNVLRNFEIETAHNNVNESTGRNVLRNFEIKTKHENVSSSTGIDVSRNFEIETAHDNVNESTGTIFFRNFEISTELDNVNESTGLDISRNFGPIIIYPNVAYQLEIVRSLLKLDHSYSSHDDRKLRAIKTGTDNDFDGFLNYLNDQDTAEENKKEIAEGNETVYHDLALADNVTVEIDGFEELYIDLKEIVKRPYIILKDEKIKIVELYEKMVKLCVLIDSNYHVEIFVHNRPLPLTHKIFSLVTKERVNVSCIEVLLRHLKEYQVCIGNPQPYCLERLSGGGFVYEGESSRVIAFREDDFGARKNCFAESYSETEIMLCKNRRVVRMLKQSNGEAVGEKNETAWPEPVVKVEVVEEVFGPFYQEHSFANVSSADSDASVPIIMDNNAYSLHTSNIASCANSAFDNFGMQEIETEHDHVNESTVIDEVSRNFEIKSEHGSVNESACMDVSSNLEIKTEHDSVSESTGMDVLRNFEKEHDSVNESTCMDVSRNFEKEHDSVNESTGMEVSTNFKIKTERGNVNESAGMDVLRNVEIKTGHDIVNESTGMEVSKNFEIKTGLDSVNESTGMDVSRNFEIKTGHDNVNKSTGMDVSRNFEIKIGYDIVNDSTGMDDSRNVETVVIYRNVAYPIRLDHNYSSEDDDTLPDVETESGYDFDGFLNCFNDKETTEGNETVYHDLALADNVTVQIDGFEELYNDLKAIVRPPYIILKDEKIRIIELYEKMVKLCVLIDSNFQMEIFVHNRPLPQTHKLFSFVTKDRVNVSCIEVLLRHLKEYKVCIGNPQLERVSKGGFVRVFEGKSSKEIAYREIGFGARKNNFAESYFETVRSVTCDLLLNIFKLKNSCPSCTSVGNNLWSGEKSEKKKLSYTEFFHPYAIKPFDKY